MDYLLSESFYRSGGAIEFPHVFEADFAYFKFFAYGHAPGTFFGEDGVWPYLPAGLISVSNPLVNWIGGVGNDALYVSLTNSAGAAQQVIVDLATELTGIPRGFSGAVELVTANGSRSTGAAVNGRVTVNCAGARARRPRHPERGRAAPRAAVRRRGRSWPRQLPRGRHRPRHRLRDRPRDAPGAARRTGLRRLRADRH